MRDRRTFAFFILQNRNRPDRTRWNRNLFEMYMSWRIRLWRRRKTQHARLCSLLCFVVVDDGVVALQVQPLNVRHFCATTACTVECRLLYGMFFVDISPAGHKLCQHWAWVFVLSLSFSLSIRRTFQFVSSNKRTRYFQIYFTLLPRSPWTRNSYRVVRPCIHYYYEPYSHTRNRTWYSVKQSPKQIRFECKKKRNEIIEMMVRNNSDDRIPEARTKSVIDVGRRYKHGT